MNPIDFTPHTVMLNLERVVLGIVALFAACILSFGAGYLYKGHRVSLGDAAREAKTQTIATTTQAATQTIDSRALDRLAGQIANANARAANLEQQLKDQSHATPAPADCRLPVGLRDQINADLASGSR